MINPRKLSQAQASSLIYRWLNKRGYDQVFKADVSMILAENRRTTRSGGRARWGQIPYALDIQDFVNSRLLPACIRLERQRLEKAAKAAKGARLPYAT
ncbi:hypothetical protein [Methylomicrobium agile]|uniref:hypothetical protein n=1 Tax=Methylomicrobium agile TaxID=39774 RepID=UPI0012F6EF01|nr:hypothetical protein [Methylomicrobium agile]